MAFEKPIKYNGITCDYHVPGQLTVHFGKDNIRNTPIMQVSMLSFLSEDDRKVDKNRAKKVTFLNFEKTDEDFLNSLLDLIYAQLKSDQAQKSFPELKNMADKT
jgi:hypothetical protein